MNALLIVGQLLHFPFIGKLIEAKVISPAMGRVIEGALQTAILGLLTYIGNVIETGDFSQWEATAVVIGIGFVKTVWSGIVKAYRDSVVEKKEILDIIN